jgi:hypothetical protein
MNNRYRHYLVLIKASVDINGVDPSEVFALVTDLRRKFLFCPNVAVIDISRQPDGAVGVDTIFHHRIALDDHIADYNNRVVAFSPGKRMVTESESNPFCRIEVTVEPCGTGARLTQREAFDLKELEMPVYQAPRWSGKLYRSLFSNNKMIQPPGDLLAQEAEEMHSHLQPRLDAWLNNIKEYLEHDTHYKVLDIPYKKQELKVESLEELKE